MEFIGIWLQTTLILFGIFLIPVLLWRLMLGVLVDAFDSLCEWRER